MTWHHNQETLREVGNDPAKFKEGIAKATRESLMKDPEFRKQLIAELRAEAGDDGPPAGRKTPPSSFRARSMGRPAAHHANPSMLP